MRDNYWDVVKGIAIIAVIIIHSCTTAGLFTYSDGALKIITLRAVVNFAVPVFFALSGFLNGRSKSPKDLAWVYRRLAAIIPTYLIWTTIFIVLFNRSHITQPTSLIKDFMFGSGIGIGYFVIVLTQFTIMTPVLARIRSIRAHIVTIFVLTAMGLSFTYFIQFHHVQPLSRFPFNAILFPVWYPFYHLGFIAGQRGWFTEAGSRASIIATAFAVVLLLVASIFEGLALRGVSLLFATSQLRATSFIYSSAVFLLILLLHSRAENIRASGLAWLGRNSYAVYLTHLIPIRIAMKFAGKFGLAPGELLFVTFVASFVGLLCIFGVWLGRHFLPAYAQRWMLS